MSIWEAQARRKNDAEQAKDAETISLDSRQRIQQAPSGLCDASSGFSSLRTVFAYCHFL